MEYRRMEKYKFGANGIFWFARKIPLAMFVVYCAILGACGIEDYPIIPPVPDSNITRQFNDRATVRIPNDYAETPFTNFAVFYRIYVSDTPQPSIMESTFSAINPTLASDYNVFKGYIDSTTAVNVNMDAIFQGRGYKYLELQGDSNIYSVLSSSVFGTILEFNFSSSRDPSMTVGANTYTLWRSNGNGLFNPRPDRLFRNREELYRSENISNPTINADVAGKSGVTDGRLYTYAAMFIVAVGVNTASYSPIYSTPALIHVFQLPD